MTHATSFRHLSVVHYDGLSILTLKNDQKRLKLFLQKIDEATVKFSSQFIEKNIVMITANFYACQYGSY